MSALWHWFLGFFSSLYVLFSFGIPPIEDVVTQQHNIEQPEVAGVDTAMLQQTNLKRFATRLEGWEPPATDNLTAASIMIMDKSSGKVLWSRSPDKLWPAASITKLMSAIIFMEAAEEDESLWGKTYKMVRADEEEGTTIIYRGEEVTVDDLFNISLIGSVNSATSAYLHAAGLSDITVVKKMNKMARSMGLWNTNFEDVTGLSRDNVITSKEAAWLLKEALSYDKIKETLIKGSYSFETRGGRSITVQNTNKLLGNGLEFEGGKTGHIFEAKYNVVMSVKNDARDAVIVVILGADKTHLRFSEAEALARWAFSNYEWR